MNWLSLVGIFMMIIGVVSIFIDHFALNGPEYTGYDPNEIDWCGAGLAWIFVGFILLVVSPIASIGILR